MKKVLLIALVVFMLSASFAFAEEPVELHVIASMKSTTVDVGELEPYLKSEQEANVKINWEYYRTGWDEKKPLLLATGELPDIFFGRYTLNASDISQNLEYFVPLNDLIAEHAPNIQRMFDEWPELKEVMTWPDGNIYALPHVMPFRPTHLGAAYINQQWLDNLGLSYPTTTEELKNVLIAFRDEDANGNGDPNDEIPALAFIYHESYGFRIFMGSFGITDSCTSDFAYDDDGNVIYVPATEGYKNWVKWIADLYQEGLIYPDFLTMDWPTILGLQGNAGECIVGLTCSWNKGVFPAEYYDEMVQVLPLVGPDGYQEWPSNPMQLKCGTGSYPTAAITTMCEDPVAAIRWLDTFFTDERGFESFYGPIGITIEKTDTGYRLLPNQEEDISEDQWVWKYGMNDNFVGYVSQAAQDVSEMAPTHQEKMDLEVGYAPYFRDRAVPDVVMTTEDAMTVSTILTDLDSVVSTYRARWITEGGIDDEWDEYLAQLNNAGLENLIAIEVQYLAD